MIRKITAFIIAFSVIGALTSYASSVEMARSPEEWAKLRDNSLEYSEIDDLIFEYNASVKNNVYDLAEFKKKYGTDNSEIRNEYNELADELMDSIDYGDSSSPMYASSAVNAVLAESSAKSLREQADSALEDYEVYRLGYELAEKTLAQTAKGLMISCFSSQLSVRQAELNKSLLETGLAVAGTKTDLGMGTRTDVLNAQQSLINSEKQITEYRSAEQAARKKLQVMCGWKYEDDPVICELPSADLSVIDSIDVTADIERAVESNYTLRMNERKLANADSESQKKTLENTISSNRENIGISVNTAYRAVIAARDTYVYAASDSKLQNDLFVIAKEKYALGSISAVEYRTQEIEAQLSELALKQAEYSVLSAMMNYEYITNGTASA